MSHWCQEAEMCQQGAPQKNGYKTYIVWSGKVHKED